MKRGSIYWINLEPATPPEFGKTRPGLIISNSEQNLILPTVVMLPISSKPPAIPPLRISFKIPNNKISFVVVPSIRQVNQQRLSEFIGMAPASLMEQIDEAIMVYLTDMSSQGF